MNVKEMYVGNLKYKGSYLLNGNIYIKSLDNHHHIIYKKKGTFDYITKNNQIVPILYLDSNHIPLFPKGVLTDTISSNDNDINAENVVYINKIIQMNDKLQMANWEDKNGLVVKFIGEVGTYTYYKGLSTSYWKNINMKEILTNGTRNNLSSILDFNYTFLTTQIGCDKINIQDIQQLCRFSYSGIKFKDDNRFYRWYYVPTSKSIKGYIDLKSFNTIDELYDSNMEIGKVSNGNIYLKVLDENNNTCYYNSLDKLSITTKKNQLIPINYIISTNNKLDKIRIPINKNCSNIKYLDNMIIFNDRTELLKWNKALDNDQAYLNINNKVYTASHTINNDLFFESVDANEYLTAKDKSIFQNVVFTNTNRKYITKQLGGDFLYNDSLKIGKYNNYIKVKGIFSDNDKNLYAWYENPRTDLISQKLVDIFINNDLNKIYNSDIPYIFYYDGNNYILLETDKVNNELCYVSKYQIPYDYYLKLTGQPSPYGKNLPTTFNCLNANFYNNQLIVNNMVDIVNNWDNALNGYKVIFSDLDPNITDLYNSIPNEVYAKYRTLIPPIDATNTNMNIYTTSIYGENTNLNLGNRQLYTFKSLNNIDPLVRTNVNSKNNITDNFTLNKMNMYIFDDITNISGGNGNNVQIVPNACKMIVDGYWDYSQGNGGNTLRKNYSGNGFNIWSDTSSVPNDIPLFVENNKLYVSHNYKFKYNGGSEIIDGGFIYDLDNLNNVKEVISADLNSFYNNSYTVPTDIKNAVLFNNENFLKIKYQTNCTTTNCPKKFKVIHFRNDNNVITLAPGYSILNNDPNIPIHNSEFYTGIEFNGYHFLSGLNYSILPYTSGIGAELSYYNSPSSITKFFDFYTGNDGTKPNSGFLSDFYIWNNNMVFKVFYQNSTIPYVIQVDSSFNLSFLWSDTNYVVDHILGSINNLLLLSIKNGGNYYLYTYDGSAVNLLGTFTNIQPINKPKLDYLNKTSTKFYFKCSNATIGNEICSTDGSTVNTIDITSGTASTSFQGLIVYNNLLYFGNNADHKIYSFDGTNINLINDTFVSGTSNNFFKNPIIYNNRIYFSRNDECGPYLIEGNPNTTGQKWDVLHYLIP